VKLQVLYFAGIREKVGRDAETFESAEPVATVAALRALLVARGAVWQEALEGTRNLRVAVNQSMAGPDTPLAAGDEVAFFPPVTGG
jgi:molybdopterin synthase sulfur carrier subunit